MPLRDYICHYCNHEFTELVYSQDPDEYSQHECRCGSNATMIYSSISGVQGVSLSSAKPKNRPAKKTFTGNEGNQGEPETKPEDFQAYPREKEYE